MSRHHAVIADDDEGRIRGVLEPLGQNVVDLAVGAFDVARETNPPRAVLLVVFGLPAVGEQEPMLDVVEKW